MQRKEFGQLISALRQDLGWTQFDLAEFAGVEDAVISQIERGVKKHFEPQLLCNLANAFQLTTLERREFLLAASGLDNTQMVRQPSSQVKTDVFDAQKTLGKLIHQTGQLQLPAFLCDVYSDVLAANHIILALFQISLEWARTGANQPGGFSTMRITFGRDLLIRNMVEEGWDSYALYSMRAFREASLRYRAKPYFKYLIKAFRNPIEYPLFDRYWKRVSSLEEDRESDTDLFMYQHKHYGPQRYFSSSNTTITPFGELFLIHYVPADRHTGQVFEQLAREHGGDVASFAPWPEKIIL
ncbi:MAG: helix-turn-helix domain-containing protein [Chloroflexota bacterium]